MPESPHNRTPRTLAAALALAGALLGAACAPATEEPDVEIAQGADIIADVVDSLNDAGRAPSIVLDEEGNPAVSYLLVAPVLQGDELPPAVIPGDPQPPAVMLAIRSPDGIWTRVSVTPQENSPAEGDAPEIANSNRQARPGVNTAVALDGGGTYHVVWGTPSGLYYSSGGPEGFSERQQAVASGVQGASVAATDDGTPFAAYYESGAVMVASLVEGTWTPEPVAEVGSCPECPLTRTAIDIGSDGEPVVAFSDPGAGTPMLARRDEAGAWSAEPIEEGGGGFGIDLDVDADGNPHVSYYTGEGEVRHAHSIAGGPWEVTPVGGTAAEAPTPNESAGWGSGIAVDDQGVHYVSFTDASTSEVFLATNEGGQFEPRELPGGRQGLTPDVAVSPDGSRMAVAWFDAEARNLNVALPASDDLSLAFSPQPQPTQTAMQPPTSPTGPPPCQPEGTELAISAQNLTFDTDCLAAPAGEAFSIEFTNNDAGIAHNVTIYADSSATTRLGGSEGIADVITGPTTTTYQVDPLDPGVFYFRCDVHPTMEGEFASVEGGGG